MEREFLEAVHLELIFSSAGSHVACTAPAPSRKNGWGPADRETTELIARAMAVISYTTAVGRRVPVFATCYAEAGGKIRFIPSTAIAASSLQSLLDLCMAQLVHSMMPAPDRAAS